MNQKELDTCLRVVLPVVKFTGLNSRVSRHFGRSPGFLAIDLNGENSVYLDSVTVRGPSECAPIRAIVDTGAKVVLAKGMGRGALKRCYEAGLQIFEANGDTVEEVLQSLRIGGCPEFPDSALCNHGHDHHHHDDENASEDSGKCS